MSLGCVLLTRAGSRGVVPGLGWRIAAQLVLLPVAFSAGCATFRQPAASDRVVAARQLSLRGLDAMQRADWEQAEKLFGLAIETNPADERAHRRYAEVLWRRELKEQAVRHMEEAVRLSGGDPEILVELGEMYLAQGNLDGAWRQAEAAIAAQRQLASAWALRGDILRSRQQLDEAMESYHRALSYQPNYPHVQIALSDLYRQQNRPRRALSTLESLVEQCGVERAPVDVLLQQGLALKALGRYDRAVEVLTMASERGNPSVELLYHLGEAHWMAGNTASAALAVTAALARDPNHVPSRLLADQIQARQRTMTAGLKPSLVER